MRWLDEAITVADGLLALFWDGPLGAAHPQGQGTSSPPAATPNAS
ncbi:MAG: hypothetical protein R2698_00195 [Microthrixaceae bacterium]